MSSIKNTLLSILCLLSVISLSSSYLKRIGLIAIAALSFGFSSIVSADTDQYFPLKLYSYNSKIPLGEIASYRKDNVRYINDEGRWVNVRIIGGIPAWLKKEDISLSSDKSSVSITKSSTRLYINSTSTSRYLMTLKQGYSTSVIEDVGQWVQVTSPDTLAVKVRKRDYDRIYTRFGSSKALSASDTVIPNARPKPVVREKRTSTSAGSPVNYSQTQIRNLPDATVSSAPTPSVSTYSNQTGYQAQYVEPIVGSTQQVAQPTYTNSASSSYQQSYQGTSVYATTGLRDYNLTPGDVVSISVFGEPEMTVNNVKIPVNGFISFPLVGQVFVAGKTPSEVESSIEGSLAGGYLSDPKVNLSIDVYRPVYVRGAVYSPGSYDFNVGLTVAKLLTTAGGANREAIKDTVKLFRNNAVYLENLNVDSQELIHPGDIVSVEEKPEEVFVEEAEPEIYYIYLHGEVTSPGEYEFRDGLTVEKAVALAGGFGPRASKKRIDISREVVGQDAPEKIKRVVLHYNLQPGDIIHVGESWF